MQVDNDRALDAEQGQAHRRQQRLRLHRAHVPQARRSARRSARSTSTRWTKCPDSSWFTNRIGRRAMTLDEIVRGPNAADTLNIEDWPIVEGQEQRHHPRLSHRRARWTSLPGQVRPAEQPGDGQRRRGHRRRHLSCRSATTSSRATSWTSTRRRSSSHPTATTVDMRGRKTAHDARRHRSAARARRRGCPTANTARRSAASPTAGRSATSSTTARGPTIRTTSTRTSIAASCAPIASLPPG